MRSSKLSIVPRPERDREELAFLPAALEIVETPPSPVGRLMALSLISLFCLALVWSIVGRVDIVASATGKIIPDGHTKVIQPFETGVVRAIHVHDGQRVAAGDLLIELDSTINAAEREHLRSDLTAAQLDIARLRAALSGEENPVAAFQPPAAANAVQIAIQRQFLTSQVAEHVAKVAALDRQKGQKEAERATIAATIDKLNMTIPLLQEKADVRKYLMDRALGSKIVYLGDLLDLVNQQQDLIVQRSRLNEADAAVAALVEARAQTEAEYQRTLSADLVTASQKAAGLSEDLIKAEERTRLQRLTAPIAGTVQQLAIHTVGGVVTPAQPLVVLVPEDSRLEIEAMVANRDVGFVHAGQAAEIKVDAFNFTKYGLLHGRVLSVSQDAITQQNQQRPGNKPEGAENDTSEPAGQQLVYSMRVSLDRAQIQVDDKLTDLAPGMAVTVEVKTGSRRIIDYLLSPLLKYRQESLRER
jgi:hemolysin D